MRYWLWLEVLYYLVGDKGITPSSKEKAVTVSVTAILITQLTSITG
ncbi:hypothetical protein JY546_11965 [Providencia stuartii]|uniref:Uncharacterized protein n=1 Tax=Providencia stuartii ATCC 25827 TaxID=471874 RepID=A0AA86YP06_PROST|nr:hypothetical protein [Providencia stuartii]EDU61363.1 hypothetical protein PROSTU_00553 [Providencia stuartii ATCC 25827]MBN5561476.1 hypothetical protein [Providencia stuartii]MBN5606093.1 hypothetical protein [Providencia stuartii]QUC25353.1 hypothetical protein JY390_18160 [Providencia stuartii]HEM8220169.1 hypothetical protein [Providencia stuartii]